MAANRLASLVALVGWVGTFKFCKPFGVWTPHGVFSSGSGRASLAGRLQMQVHSMQRALPVMRIYKLLVVPHPHGFRRSMPQRVVQSLRERCTGMECHIETPIFQSSRAIAIALACCIGGMPFLDDLHQGDELLPNHQGHSISLLQQLKRRGCEDYQRGRLSSSPECLPAHHHYHDRRYLVLDTGVVPHIGMDGQDGLMQSLGGSQSQRPRVWWLPQRPA